MKKLIKNKIAKIFVILTCTITLFSCKKTEQTQIQILPTAQSLKNLFDANLNSIKQTASFDAATTYTFTSAQGTTLVINGSCLRKNGNPVTGMVQLEFIEVYDRATMALTNKLTMAINGNNEEEVLESGGEFYVNATQDGISLTTTCGMSLKVPTSITGGTKAGMQLFDGAIDSAGNLSWTVTTAQDFYVQSNPDKYAVILSSFGWYNCDKFFNDPRPKTAITVLIPSGYENASQVFLSTNEVPNSLGRTGGDYPIGLECNIIFVTEDNGNFRYVIKPITVVNNQQVVFSISETALATAAQFKAVINALP